MTLCAAHAVSFCFPQKTDFGHFFDRIEFNASSLDNLVKSGFSYFRNMGGKQLSCVQKLVPFATSSGYLHHDLEPLGQY